MKRGMPLYTRNEDWGIGIFGCILTITGTIGGKGALSALGGEEGRLDYRGC